MATMAIHITGDEAADQVLTDSPFALLVGMMLDQQYPMEHAFRGPHKVLTRFGTIEPAAIAAADPEEFATLCSTPPAIHRYGRSMAARLQTLAGLVESDYGGDAARIWTEADTGQELLDRVMELPGFGKQKAQIFVALLAKQLGVRPDGLGAGRRRLRGGRLPLGGGRHRRRLPAEGARLQEGQEGRGQGAGRLTCGPRCCSPTMPWSPTGSSTSTGAGGA